MIFRCKTFLQKPAIERLPIVKQRRLCFNFLNGGHGVKDCSSRGRCRDCVMKDHTLFPRHQRYDEGEIAKKRFSESMRASASIKNKVGICLQIIPVYVIKNVPGAYKTTQSLLDSEADCHLIDKELYSDINLTGRPMLSEWQMANGE